MATSTEVKEQYDTARRADQNGDFDTAWHAYEAALQGYTNGPVNELALEGFEDIADTLPPDEFATLVRRNLVRKTVDVRVRYANMNLRWGVQPDCPEDRAARFDAAERGLYLAQASLGDILTNDSCLTRADRDKLHIEAGKVDSLFGRLFTARGVVKVQQHDLPASTKRDFEIAQRFYRSAERHFKLSYDHHARILNAIHAARQERLLGSRHGVRKWLGIIAIESFRERQSYPEGARRSKREVDTAHKDLQDYDTALAAVLQRP